MLEANDIFPSLGEALASAEFSQLRAVIAKIENTDPNPPLTELLSGISGTIALPNNQVGSCCCHFVTFVTVLICHFAVATSRHCCRASQAPSRCPNTRWVAAAAADVVCIRVEHSVGCEAGCLSMYTLSYGSKPWAISGL